MIAVVGIILCVLVEKNVIDNPLLLFGKNEGSSKTSGKTQTPETGNSEVELTERTTINTIDRLFKQIHSDDNYYIYSRTRKKTDDTEYIYYDVAEPDNSRGSDVIDCIDAKDGTDEPEATTDCISPAEIVTFRNYKTFPHYRYTFKKISSNNYEFYEKSKIDSGDKKEDTGEKTDEEADK